MALLPMVVAHVMDVDGPSHLTSDETNDMQDEDEDEHEHENDEHENENEHENEEKANVPTVVIVDDTTSRTNGHALTLRRGRSCTNHHRHVWGKKGACKAYTHAFFCIWKNMFSSTTL